MTRTVLITGASTGIGEATALHLDSRGWRVFAGVRKPADATRLQDQASPGLTTLLLDVTDTASIQAAAATVAAQNAGRLDALVANAGISGGDPLEFAPLDSVRTMLDVNVVGVVATIQAFTDQVRAARGRIVCTGSIGGRTPVPFTAAYAASKAAVAALCDCLRVELRPWGIDVVLVEPGSVQTPIWDKGLRELDTKLDLYPPRALELYAKVFDPLREVSTRTARSGVPPSRVASVIERALTARRPRTRYLIGADARVQALVRRLPDRARDRIIASYLRLPSRP